MQRRACGSCGLLFRAVVAFNLQRCLARIVYLCRNTSFPAKSSLSTCRRSLRRRRAFLVFAYRVSITNTGEVAAQLISRHWVICDSAGHTDEVKGLGVVGHQPLLKPGESFQYASGSRLATASGTMHGSYFCVAQDGTQFNAAIAMFALQAQPADGCEPVSTRVLH